MRPLRFAIALLALVSSVVVLACSSDPVKSDACAPKTCSELKLTCGAQSDGCGGTIQCGTCQTAGGGLCVHGQCVCKGRTCPDLGRSCGAADDGCHGQLDCGTCPAANSTCTVQGDCVCVGQLLCPKLGVDCGWAPDGCASKIFCGNCPMNTPNCVKGKCTTDPCTPDKSCNGRCGIVPDGCGDVVMCPTTCANPKETCGGGTVPNVCGCLPKTCAQLGKNCGMLEDGCGGMVNCGTCTAPYTCQSNNTCGCPMGTNCETK